MVTFYRYSQTIAILKRSLDPLPTTNPVESPFLAVRLRTNVRQSLQEDRQYRALMWKILMIADSQLRRFNLPELLGAVYDGQLAEDGMPAEETTPSAAVVRNVGPRGYDRR